MSERERETGYERRRHCAKEGERERERERGREGERETVGYAVVRLIVWRILQGVGCGQRVRICQLKKYRQLKIDPAGWRI